MEIPENIHLLALIAGVAWLMLESLFLGRLKRLHPEVYEELGSPSLLFNLSYNPLVTFLYRRRHTQLNDRVLAILGDLYAVAFLLLFVSLVLFLLK